MCSVCNGEYGDLAAPNNYANKYKKDEDGTYYRACQNAGCTARDSGYHLYRIIHSGGDGGGLWFAQKYSKEDTCTLSILSNVPAYAAIPSSIGRMMPETAIPPGQHHPDQRQHGYLGAGRV